MSRFSPTVLPRYFGPENPGEEVASALDEYADRKRRDKKDARQEKREDEADGRANRQEDRERRRDEIDRYNEGYRAGPIPEEGDEEVDPSVADEIDRDPTPQADPATVDTPAPERRRSPSPAEVIVSQAGRRFYPVMGGYIDTHQTPEARRRADEERINSRENEEESTRHTRDRGERLEDDTRDHTQALEIERGRDARSEGRDRRRHAERVEEIRLRGEEDRRTRTTPSAAGGGTGGAGGTGPTDPKTLEKRFTMLETQRRTAAQELEDALLMNPQIEEMDPDGVAAMQERVDSLTMERDMVAAARAGEPDALEYVGSIDDLEDPAEGSAEAGATLGDDREQRRGGFERGLGILQQKRTQALAAGADPARVEDAFNAEVQKLAQRYGVMQRGNQPR
jgi:hypothetical protein